MGGLVKHRKERARCDRDGVNPPTEKAGRRSEKASVDTQRGGGLLKSTRKAGTDADDDYVQQASEAADMHERAFEDSREMRKLFKDLDNLAKAKQVPKPPSSTPVNTGHSFRHSTFCQIY